MLSISDFSRKPIKVAYVLEDTGISGGVRVVFDHVRILNRSRIFRAVVVSPGSYPSWLEYNIPFVQTPYQEADLSDADVVVTTFFLQADLFFMWPSKVFLHLCQGYEADYVDDLGVPERRREIEAFYRLGYPKMTVTRHLKSRLEGITEAPVLFVGQPFDAERYREIGEGDDTGKDAILVIGNFRYPFKGVRESLQVAAALKRVFPSLRVVRVATEDTREEEKGMWDEFWIRVPPKDMPQFFQRAKLLIHMAYKEGFGLPLLEAMASGIPVVARDIPVFREVCGEGYPLCKDEEEAFLFAVELLSNEGLYREVRERGFVRVRDFGMLPFCRRLFAAMFTALRFGR